MRHSIYKHHLAPCFDSTTQFQRGRNLNRTSVILKRQFRSNRRPSQRLNSIAAKSAIEWDPKMWCAAYDGVEETPEGYWITDVKGEIPPQLTGTYFRNGPGRTKSGTEEAHPYDADGLVVSIAIKDGNAFFRARFVTTQEHLLEVDSGGFLFPGAFGTLPLSEDRRLAQIHSRNAANTNIALIKDKLWTLYEFSQPYELDPFTLKTLGVPKDHEWITKGEAFDSGFGKGVNSVLGGLIKSVNNRSLLDELGGCGVSVHPKYDPRQKTTIIHTYKLRFSPKDGSLETVLKIYELDEDFEIKRQILYTFPRFVFLHDIAFTMQYYIIIENPVHFDLWSYLFGQESAVGCVQWTEHEPSKVHFIRRPEPGSENLQRSKSHTLLIPPSFVFHIANAFEEDESVYIDAIHYKRFPNLSFKHDSRNALKNFDPEKQPISRLKRIVCNPRIQGEFTIHEISRRAMEFPSLNPSFSEKRHRFVYTLAALHPDRNAPPQAIAKIEVETGETRLWSPGAGYYAGEPAFVPHPNSIEGSEGEDHGWLLSLSFNGKTKKSELVILDARDIEAGPIAVLKLNHHLPHGLHGTWTSKHFGP